MYTISFQGIDYNYRAKNAFHALQQFQASLPYKNATLSEQFSYRIQRAS